MKNQATRKFSQKDQIPLQLHMMHLATGHFRTQAIYVAAKLGIIDNNPQKLSYCDDRPRPVTGN